MNKILLVLTGGTICSFGDEDNLNRDVDVVKANRLIIDNFRNSDSIYMDCEFETDIVLDVLSENMTVENWNVLIDYLRNKDTCGYSGIIITHGTDTLAYSASLISILLSDKDIPVFIVSSNMPLNMKEANGNANFRIAVESIGLKIAPLVYVPYRNSNGVMYLHNAAHLMQCVNYKDDFKSYDMIKMPRNITKENVKYAEKSFLKNIIEYRQRCDNCNDNQSTHNCDEYNDKESRHNYDEYNDNEHRHNCDKYNDNQSKHNCDNRFLADLKHIKCLKKNVLFIKPYVGIDYSAFNLENIKAVVHSMYHSMTACTGENEDNPESDSILYLLDKCRSKNIAFITEPAKTDICKYVSSDKVLGAGAMPVYGMTSEMTYVKTLLAAAIYENPKDIYRFVNADLCGEFVAFDK